MPEGFIRTTYPETPAINASQKAQLIRKGNELFNAGKVEEARKIFLTAKYSDGLARIGDFYYAQKNYLTALQNYILASEKSKKEYILEKIAEILRKWLTESK